MEPNNVTGSPMNPQSWNLYSYVKENPMNFNDPNGHEGFHAEDWGSGKYTLSGEGKHKRLLDSSDEYSYWKMARYKQELDNLFRSN